MHLFQTIIISILLSNNKIIMNLNYRDLMLINITIKNLDAKTWQSQK